MAKVKLPRFGWRHPLWWLAGQARWRRWQLGRWLMGHGGCKCFSELMVEVTMNKGRILPKPEWCQDVAFLAFIIDGLRGHKAVV